MKTPPEYSLPVDFSKVVLTPINAWVMQRVKELLKGLEDEVLVGTITESLKQACAHLRTCASTVILLHAMTACSILTADVRHRCPVAGHKREGPALRAHTIPV